MTDPLQIALSQYGVKEITGPGDSETILQYAEDCGFTDYKHDDTAWCSLFINWVMFQAGKPRSKVLSARSWLKVGEATDNPEPGDVVVLWRGSKESWQGHVGLFCSKQNGVIYILGGNQRDGVNVTGYLDIQLLGYRRVV